MSLCFSVQHIVHPLTHPRFGRRSRARIAWYAQHWGFLERVCSAMEWQQLPWDEPGDVDEESKEDFFCCSWSTYGRFREFVTAVATVQGGMLADIAPHVTDRADSNYRAIYVPVPFPKPVKLYDDPDWHTVTIGSSIHMLTVLEVVQGELANNIEERYPGFLTSEQETLQLLCEVFVQYARESVQKNLPLVASW